MIYSRMYDIGKKKASNPVIKPQKEETPVVTPKAKTKKAPKTKK